ncbi:MAG: PDZ domain-containing protein [Acidobacteria bacterium]|nr:PDZ domain-containing protein [Acidobacteriota bacterium]
MKVVRIVGVVVLILGVLAIGVAVAPAVYGQARRTQRDVVVGPRVEVFGSGSTIGVVVGDVEESEVAKSKLPAAGAVIEDVRQGTPAEKAGVRKGDIVVEFDGERVRSAAQFGRLVRETPPGRSVKMVVMRDGQRNTLDITPAERQALSSTLIDIAPEIASAVGNEMSRLGRNLELRLGDLDLMRGSAARRGRLGVTLQELTPQLAEYFGAKDGALVTSVRDGSPAQAAGIKAGDVITAINDESIENAGDVTRAIARARQEITVKVMRDKKELTLKTKLEPIERRSRRVLRQVY